MPTYIGLLRFTEQGMRNVKESPDRVGAATQMTEEAGGELKAFYYTMGEYDAVSIVEAPDDETVSRIVLAISGQGNARFVTLRAFTVDEMRGIVSGLR